MNIFTLILNKKVDLIEQHITTLIDEGCTISGDLKAKNYVRIDGVIEGNVMVEHGLILGEKGIIKGDVKTQDVIIYGTIKGNVQAKQLEIKTTGRIKGSITTQKIQIDMGATYNGVLSMFVEDAKNEILQTRQINEVDTAVLL